MNLQTVSLLVRSYYSGTKPWTHLFHIVSARRPDKPIGTAKKTMRIVGSIFLGLLLAFSFAMLMIMIGVNYYSFQQMGLLIGLPDLGLFLAEILGAVIVFLFSCMTASSTLYRGKDLALLMTVPIRQSELLASRLILLYVAMFPIYFFMVLPGIVIVWSVTGWSVPLVFGGLLTLLLGPVAPVLLGSVFGMLIMKMTKGRNNKVLIELISILLVMGLVLFAQGGVLRMSGLDETADPSQLVAALGATVSAAYKSLFYFACQASMSFSNYGFLNAYLAIALNILINVALAALVILLLARSYSQCVSIAQNGANKAKRRRLAASTHFSRKRRSALFTPSSRVISLAAKDWEIVKGTPAFLTELVGEVCIPIILVIVYALSGILGEMQGMLESVRSSAWFSAGVCGTLILLSSFTMVSSTSVSREGSLFALSRSWPVSSRIYVNGKMVFHMILLYIPHVIYLFLCSWIFGIDAINLPWMLLLGFFTIFGTGALDLAIDYRRPVLDWKLPQQAIKQNLNGLIGMGLSLLYLLVVAAAAIVSGVLGLVPMWCMYVAAAVSMLLAFISYKVALGQAKIAYLPQ